MRGTRIRRVLLQGQALILALTTAYMSYVALGLLTNCQSPVFVVLSGSMEPGIRRGDILFLTNYKPHEYKYENGNIVVYKIAGETIPIVHRVMQTVIEPQMCATYYPNPGCPGQQLLTKGDNNDVDDVGLYKGLERLEKEHIVGKVRFIIPLVGYGSILLKNGDPRVRYAIFAFMGLVNLMRN
ncbi:signal peptidase I [Mycena alexandri]|uniref:Signal peptidase complex catalytic subunit SEC11 n=1 Tax=Mycena alexandri TaxID=1745969 RepID=A0AAD6TFK3_9AGAR|nr:signal peptidase I [Mycena alexandri]